MSTSLAEQLAAQVRAMAAKLGQACSGISEEAARRAPKGRWTPREIVSHLSGPEGLGYLPLFQLFLDADTPLIELVGEDPFYSPARQAKSFAALVAECLAEYEAVARFAAALSGEQLARTARVPLLKDSPLGEYPSLQAFIGGLCGFHIQFHIDHLKEVSA